MVFIALIQGSRLTRNDIISFNLGNGCFEFNLGKWFPILIKLLLFPEASKHFNLSPSVSTVSMPCDSAKMRISVTKRRASIACGIGPNLSFNESTISTTDFWESASASRR